MHHVAEKSDVAVAERKVADTRQEIVDVASFIAEQKRILAAEESNSVLGKGSGSGGCRELCLYRERDCPSLDDRFG